jgi:hypothetical protein
MDRRSFLTGLGVVLAAPAIVHIDNIMPVRNRLLVPMTFSCYLKNPSGVPIAGAEPAGNGWYRYTTFFDGQPGKVARVKLPTGTCNEIRFDFAGYPDGVDVDFGGGLKVQPPDMWGAQLGWKDS